MLGVGTPNGNGQSLASTWKEDLRRAGVPVVASASLTPGLSAKTLATLRSQVLAAGAIMVVSD